MFFGISSIRELLPLLFKGTGSIANFLIWVLAITSQIITGFIWTSVAPVYFLWSLILIDFLTGIGRAIFIRKDFGSKRFPKVVLSLIGNTLMLYIAHQSSIHSNVLYYFFPSFIYSVLISTQIISIIENLTELGLFNRDIYNYLKSKVSPKAIIDKLKPKGNE